jgi:hypothetical protein
MVNISADVLFPDEMALLFAIRQVASIKWQPHTVGGLPSSNKLSFTCSSILLIAFLYRLYYLYHLINRRRALCLPLHR